MCQLEPSRTCTPTQATFGSLRSALPPTRLAVNSGFKLGGVCATSGAARRTQASTAAIRTVRRFNMKDPAGRAGPGALSAVPNMAPKLKLDSGQLLAVAGNAIRRHIFAGTVFALDSVTVAGTSRMRGG